MTQRGAGVLVLIAVFKLTKAALLLALALDVLRSSPQDVAHMLASWATQLQIDPDGEHVGRFLQTLAALDQRRLRAITDAMFGYAALFILEGTGLLLRQRWAEYFTAIMTASLIPLEVYELARHHGALRAAVVIVNVAIVWYLVRRVRRGE